MFECFGIDVMQKFILLRGHEGAGKSTFAQQKIGEFKQHHANSHIILLDNDLYLLNENGVYCFDFERFAQAHQKDKERFQAALQFGQCNPTSNILIINANPNQKAKACYTQLQQAQSYGFITEIYRLHYFFDNVHGVSQDDVNRSYIRLNNNPVEGEIHIPNNFQAA